MSRNLRTHRGGVPHTILNVDWEKQLNGSAIKRTEEDTVRIFTMFDQIISIIRTAFNLPEGFIPLHVPHFDDNEREKVIACIDSSYVSSVGPDVNLFEEKIEGYTGTKKAIAVTNGTAALHLALVLAGVKRDELVITQTVSFIATANSIAYIGADPLFVDIDLRTLGLSSDALESFFHEKTEIRADGKCYHLASGKRIGACAPMHTYGFPTEIDRIVQICDLNAVPVVEDAAEALGTTYKGKHVGTFGKLGIFSFNGNKIITCGGGGMVVTNDEELAKLAKHLTTQAKMQHRWKFAHDHIAYNYRMPNLNAALGVAQMEKMRDYLENKRELADLYSKGFADLAIEFISAPLYSAPNNWLNAILFKDLAERDAFLEYSNDRDIMTRPAWELTHTLSMFEHCIYEDLSNSQKIYDTLVNIPSSVRIK